MDNITSTTEQVLYFSWFDYTLFFLMLLLSALIGIYFGCFGSKQNTTSEYLLGSRKMKVFPVGVSLTAGQLSGITLLGLPAEIYMYGGQYYGSLLTAFVVGIAIMYIYLPPFYTLRVNSSYEYLKIRFDERVRTIALVFYIISSFLFIPLVIFVPALAFNQISGTSIYVIAISICFVCIFYTTLGGLRAVVWTDTLQLFITFAALLMVSFLGIREAGGLKNILEIAQEGDRLDFFNMDPDPTIRTTFWGVVIPFTIARFAAGIVPSNVQRFLSVPTLGKAKLTVLILTIGMLSTKFLICSCGYIIYAKYYKCDPFTTKKINHPDQILPYYVLDVAKAVPGLSGLFIAGVFSTALSTMSAHLNTLGAVLYKDFFSKFLSTKISDQSANRIIKITVMVAGIICVGMIFIVERLGGIVQALGIIQGISTGPLLGLFTLGMLFPQVTTKAALYASTIGLAIMTWLIGGFQYHYIKKHIRYSYKPLAVDGCNTLNETLSFFAINSTKTNESSSIDKPMYLFRLSFYWYPLIGFLLVILIGVAATYLSKEENEAKKRYNKDLYSPLIHRFIKENPVDYESVDNALKLVKLNSGN